MTGEGQKVFPSQFLQNIFFLTCPKKSYLVKTHRETGLLLSGVFSIYNFNSRSFKVNVNGRPVVPALDKTFYTEHAAERKPQVNIPRELIHPESSHRPPPTQPPCRAFRFFFPVVSACSAKYCFVLQGRGAAARGHRREGLMGRMLKLMGNTSPTHQEAFLTLTEKGRGLVGAGG